MPSTDLLSVRPIRRSGLSAIWVVLSMFVIIVALAGVGLATYGIPGMGNAAADDAEVRVVKRGQFVHRVTETGDIESSENVEIRCEVKARGSQGTPIIEVVPEGTMVEEGDILVELDATAFETQKTSQEMATAKAEAAVTSAQSVYDTAVSALEEYEKGTYVQEDLKIRGEIAVAEENVTRAEQYLVYSKKLAVKGYVTPLQLEADQFALEKARHDLEIALNKKLVLDKITKISKINELKSSIETATAKLEAEKNGYELELQELEEILAQIDKCTVKAPSDGQVVHANQRSRRGGSDVVIEPGVVIRQNQVMIRLPDPSKMQVKAKINEARVDLVKPGMTASITIGAFPDLALMGEVEKVNRYAEPGSWFSTNVKAYATFIKIGGSHEKLRPGLTAEVQIEVARLDDVLTLPITCVTEHGGKHYCLVRKGVRWEPYPREVQIGPSNETHVVLESGVTEGEVVAANPQRHREQATWPKIEEKDPSEDLPDKPSSSSPEQPKSPGGGNPMASMFRQRDTNSDGKLTQDEVGQGWSFVSKFDRNADGAIDKGEMATGLAAMKNADGPPQGGPGATP